MVVSLTSSSASTSLVTRPGRDLEWELGAGSAAGCHAGATRTCNLVWQLQFLGGPSNNLLLSSSKGCQCATTKIAHGTYAHQAIQAQTQVVNRLATQI